jgi:Flp pilus assembly protein TadG
MSFLRASARNERGQALVEFAIVLPMLLLLLLGIVDFARAWNVYEVLTDAAREGARIAVVDHQPAITEQDVRDAIVAAGQRAAIGIDPADITITGFDAGRGTRATVRIEYDHELKWVGALLGLISGERTLSLTSEFAMRNE